MPKNKTFSFRCSHCKKWVVLNEQIGTAHRNHCPFCLWSKHVDEKKAGDRKSECKGAMAPIGLTFKKEPPNKYGPPRPGELMIIHECKQCGQLRINRLSADDNTNIVLQVFEQSQGLDGETRERFEAEEITLLTEENREEIMTQLYGKTQAD